MSNDQLETKLSRANRLLNDACEIITQLEHNATSEQVKEIDAMFNEIKYADHVDAEMKADAEAQDFDTFGTEKI
tara:strand:+ start:1218 stop:1439 length:222 start_codon:yes stop_codon:yes gene_type:complete